MSYSAPFAEVLWVFTIFFLIWLGLSIILLLSWRYRKNLAIMQEYLIVLMSKNMADKAIEKYKTMSGARAKEEKQAT